MILDYRTKPEPGSRREPGWRIYDGAREEFVHDCFYANTETGRYGVYLRDAAGSFYHDPQTRKAAVVWRVGSLLLLPPNEEEVP